MKVVTVRDFRDKASEMFRSDDVILVTRDGAPAGFYLCPGTRPTCPSRLAAKSSFGYPNRSASSSAPKAPASKRCLTISLPVAVVADATSSSPHCSRATTRRLNHPGSEHPLFRQSSVAGNSA